MGNYYAEDVEYLLLKAVSECREPVGAGFLAETFANRKDLALSEATIGRHLRRLEQKGYLCCERYSGRSRGRVMTKKGSDRMKELGFLNDAAYAAQVVRYYSAKGYGERKLRDELYCRGVPRELWEDALNQAQDSSTAIDAFLTKKLGGRTPDRQELKKLSDALARRGYHWSEINEALGRCGAEVELD